MTKKFKYLTIQFHQGGGHTGWVKILFFGKKHTWEIFEGWKERVQEVYVQDLACSGRADIVAAAYKNTNTQNFNMDKNYYYLPTFKST